MTSPPDMSIWQGRDDTAIEGPEALRVHQCVKPWSDDSPPGVCLLGFACDEGVRRNQGRVGAADGPRAIRRALANLAWSKSKSIYDAGNVDCNDGDLEGSQIYLSERVGYIIEQSFRLIVIGGGHETAIATFLGLTQVHPKASIGIINLDAHLDLRSSQVSHSGTPFREMAEYCMGNELVFRYLCLGVAEQSNTQALFISADDLGAIWKSDHDLASCNMAFVKEEILKFVTDLEVVYLSLDLDVLPASVMPAVSAPSAFGAPLESIESIVDLVASTGKLAVADVVEFNPTYDRDGLAAKVAARLIWGLARRWKYAPEAKRP